MKQTDSSHPYIRNLKAIKEQDVVVIDNITGPPLIGEPYIACDCLIIVCHRGEIINDQADEFALKAHDISILLPDQIAIPLAVTDDFCATNIAISRELYLTLRYRYPYTRCVSLFRRRPPCDRVLRVADAPIANRDRLVRHARRPTRRDARFLNRSGKTRLPIFGENARSRKYDDLRRRRHF